jgi:hypothetical protein
VLLILLLSLLARNPRRLTSTSKLKTIPSELFSPQEKRHIPLIALVIYAYSLRKFEFACRKRPIKDHFFPKKIAMQCVRLKMDWALSPKS